MDKKSEYGVKILSIKPDSIHLIARLGKRGDGPSDMLFNITDKEYK